MLKVTYKSGEVKEVQEPFKVSKEEYQLIEKVEKANDYRKYIKNAFQCFIHSVNFLSRNSVESPFVNCSFFGPPKLRAMMDDDNMGWYFQKEDAVDGVPEEALKDCGDQDWIEYLIKIILDLQDIFGEVMDAGDPLHDNRPIEFPVCTVNFSRKVNEDGSVEFVDYDYVEDFCKKHDITRYNIYLSEGQKIASCCRLINDVDLFDLGGQVNSFGGSALSLGSHRVCTVNMRRIALMCDSWEDYKKRLLQKMDEAEDILIAHRALLKDLVKKGTQPFISNGWLDLDRMFSTIGLLGYYEAAQDLTERFGEHDYLGEMVDLMEAHARELTKERHNINNLEQIPAEAQSSKMCSADHWIFDGPDNEW